MKRAPLAALACVFLLACGEEEQAPHVDAGSLVGDAGGLPVDAGSQHDAGVQSDAGVAPDGGSTQSPACGVAADLGSPEALTDETVFFVDVDDEAAPREIAIEGPVGDGVSLGLELVAGKGVFAGGLKTGTFELKGAELNNATCGLCVLLYGGDYMDPIYYLATGGTVKVTSIDGQLQGSLTDVAFEHVTIADDEIARSTPVGDGCVSRIGSIGFDVWFESPPEE